MAKKIGFTIERLEAMGLTRNDDGTYSKKKKDELTLFVPNNASGIYDTKKLDIILKQKVNDSPDFEHKVNTEWFIPYQTPSKKNSRITFTNKATGRVVNIPSAKYTEYKNLTKMYWTTFGIEFQNTIKSLNLQFPLNIEMTFTRKTNQLVDYFGPGESVFDLMTDFKWWEDDNRRFGKPFFGDMIVDKNNPGVKIKILLNGK